jgi:alpha-ketoglutarate-dependent taurine dioxygenase
MDAASFFSSAAPAVLFIVRWRRLRENNDVKIEPLEGLPFGATVTGVNLENVSANTWKQIHEAFAKYSLLVFKGQSPQLSPEAQIRFGKSFDPGSTTVWRDQRTNPWELHKAKNLGGAGTFQLPRNPEVLVLGKGRIENHHGLTADLGGSRKAYGDAKGSQVLGGGLLQWHIDGAFYERLPPRASSMFCVEPPSGPSHRVEYDDGSGQSVNCPLGSTAFVSAYIAYEALERGETGDAALKAKVDGAVVHYYAHPFKVTATCSTTQNGLRTTDAKNGRPTDTDGSFGSEQGLMVHPLVWTHPVTRRRALMPHTRCLSKIVFADGSEMDVKVRCVNTKQDVPNEFYPKYTLSRGIHSPSYSIHSTSRFLASTL